MKNFISRTINISLLKKEPVSLVHFITSRCNARCPFCFIDFDNNDTFKGELNLNEIQKISNSLGSTISNINITGGEPFARKDITEIGEIYLKNKNIVSLFITTNGSLPDRIKKFVNYISPKFSKKNITFSISIDHFQKEHDRIRKIGGLFKNCIESYNFLKEHKKNILCNVAITVSEENYKIVSELYDKLKNNYGIESFTATLVRDEGVYKTKKDLKLNILNAYKNLTQQIRQDIQNKITGGYRKDTIIGRFLNAKNSIMNKQISKMYMENNYLSPCHASSLFGVINSKGDVYPCEILDKKIGNLRDYNYNFINLWNSKENCKIKKYIIESKCRCTYECAWTFNILGNYRYYPKLLKKALWK